MYYTRILYYIPIRSPWFSRFSERSVYIHDDIIILWCMCRYYLSTVRACDWELRREYNCNLVQDRTKRLTVHYNNCNTSSILTRRGLKRLRDSLVRPKLMLVFIVIIFFILCVYARYKSSVFFRRLGFLFLFFIVVVLLLPPLSTVPHKKKKK